VVHRPPVDPLQVVLPGVVGRVRLAGVDDLDRLAHGRENAAEADAADADALYRLLENEVVPAFYDRDAHGLPATWLRIVRESIRTVMPRFSARRMVKQYVESMYGPVVGGQ
jgi:starch phosphorylase